MDIKGRKKLASKLKKKRLKLGHSITECADKIGVATLATIYRWENGTTIPGHMISTRLKEYIDS